MPVYLVHGFRWPREGFSGIRVHAIVHDLLDCSVEYIQNAHSREEILSSFRKIYGDVMKDIESNGRSLEFIEQYDPEDTDSATSVSQPFAYVADKVVELAGNSISQPQAQNNTSKSSGPLLSINIEEVISNGPGLTTQAWEAIADLRDKIATGEKIGWWVVYNGDPERAYESEEEFEDESSTPTAESAPNTLMQSSEKEALSLPKSQAENGPPVPLKTSPPTEAPSGSRLLPVRSKPKIVKAEAILPSPKEEKIPEPTKLKEVVKTSGFRKKFFGKKL